MARAWEGVFVDDIGEGEARVCFVVVLQAVEEQSFEDDDAAGGAVEPGGVFVVLSFEAEAEFVDFYRDRSHGVRVNFLGERGGEKTLGV